MAIKESMMTEAEEGKYYATDTETDPVKGTENKYDVFKVNVVGNEGTTYNCTGTLKIIPKSDSDLQKEETLKATDAAIELNGLGISNETVTVKDLAEKNTNTPYEKSLTFTASNGVEQKLNIGVWFENTAEEQNSLAGKKLNLDFTITGVKCTAQSSGD